MYTPGLRGASRGPIPALALAPEPGRCGDVRRFRTLDRRDPSDSKKSAVMTGAGAAAATVRRRVELTVLILWGGGDDRRGGGGVMRRGVVAHGATNRHQYVMIKLNEIR